MAGFCRLSKNVPVIEDVLGENTLSGWHVDKCYALLNVVGCRMVDHSAKKKVHRQPKI
jgi:hypothetical protein